MLINLDESEKVETRDYMSNGKVSIYEKGSLYFYTNDKWDKGEVRVSDTYHILYHRIEKLAKIKVNVIPF